MPSIGDLHLDSSVICVTFYYDVFWLEVFLGEKKDKESDFCKN